MLLREDHGWDRLGLVKMGPLKFIIYMNDILGLGFIGNILLFADDAMTLYKFFCYNVLTMNIKKTCCMKYASIQELAVAEG